MCLFRKKRRDRGDFLHRSRRGHAKKVTSQGCKASVVFEPAAELTSRLNEEMEFRFVELAKRKNKES